MCNIYCETLCEVVYKCTERVTEMGPGTSV